MQRVTINPSIAAIVDIDSIGKSEIVPIYFTASENWTGTYELKIYNSNVKNNEKTFSSSPLEVSANVMTWTIDPVSQSINSGNYYYEITKIEDKRIIFKGNLIIIE